MPSTIPGFQTFTLNNRLVTQANTVLSSLTLARSESLKRGRQVSVCASGNGTGCTDGWHSGWVIFVDIHGDGEINGDDRIIRIYEALSAGYTLIGNTPVSKRITFDARGRSGAGTLFLCDQRGVTYARGIVVAATGRSRIIDADRCSA
jgi:type IV fimbrial biogenesis protein FimT